MSTKFSDNKIDYSDQLKNEISFSGRNRKFNSLERIYENRVLASDITMVFGVRVHEENPWIMRRIDFMSKYYDPSPNIAVVDFGSQPPFADTLKDICDKNGYIYLYEGDAGVFSLSAARNLSFQAATTDFVFFCDPDFVGERDLFERLAQTATALNMREVIDIMINPPAVHLDADNTAQFEQHSYDASSIFLRKLSFNLNFTASDRKTESFTAPYSNCFLLNRLMFTLTGGYDATFRGHGSEDFEFFLRFNLISSFLPLPQDVDKDFFGPLSPEFYAARPYKGFRRLLEMMSHPAEGLGFKVFHLHHPRARGADWYTNNDWKRKKFADATKKYIGDAHNLLSIDHLKRPKRAVCLCKNKDSWGYFLPLRIAGYNLTSIFDDKPDTIKHLVADLTSGAIDAIAIFNPYMASHSSYLGVVLLARQLHVKVIVIERGALPGTIYYDDDVCYASENFSEKSFLAASFTDKEIEEATIYTERLRQGKETLEAMNNYELTKEKYAAFFEISRPICFIPLQLEDDMAVTMFTDGNTLYPEFVDSLNAVSKNYKDTIFIIKPHPLSKNVNVKLSDNVIFAAREDNVHCLIDLASVVMCYNSGVGLLAIAHEKPTITLGNAFYNLAGAGYRAQSADEGLDRFFAGEIVPPASELVARIMSWFLFRKYSNFVAKDKIVEFEKRKAHGYTDIWVSKFLLDGATYKLGRLSQHVEFSWQSYAAARIAPLVVSGDGKNSPDYDTLLRWGLKDFHSGEYVKSAKHLTAAFSKNNSRPILLRYAAEAHYRAKNRKMAIALLKQSILAKPVVRAKLRLLVFRFPPFRLLIGSNELSVPRK